MANVNGERNIYGERRNPTIDYGRDTAYVVGGGERSPYNTIDGNPVYAPQVYSQSQLNNNMSGTDANAIYQATHDQSYNANDPGMMLYNLGLIQAGLTPYRGQQTPDDDANYSYNTGAGGSYVTGAGAFTAPSNYDYRVVAPQGMGSFEGLPYGSIPGGDQQAQYYAAILDALTRGQGASPRNQNMVRKEIATSRYA